MEQLSVLTSVFHGHLVHGHTPVLSDKACYHIFAREYLLAFSFSKCFLMYLIYPFSQCCLTQLSFTCDSMSFRDMLAFVSLMRSVHEANKELPHYTCIGVAFVLRDLSETNSV